MNKRQIKLVLLAKPTLEGAGVHLHRVFGFHQVNLFDPFLLLDDFRSDEPKHFLKGFPWHPHRGIETITYVLKGDVEHGDSLGNKGVIGSGDVQWMTAGSGIIHQEMPQGDSDRKMYGFQLWANLPASHKMMDPRYRGITAAEIPAVTLESGVSVKVIAGELNGIRGPVTDIITDPTYLDVSVPSHTEFSLPAAVEHNAFVYVYDGKAEFGKDEKSEREVRLENHQLALFTDGDSICIRTSGQAVSFLFVSGKPIDEPVAWYGPIVMNTQDELKLAFEEYQSGTFIKHQPKA